MAMAMQGPLADVYFGFDLNRLLVRVDFDEPAKPALADFDVLRIGLRGAGRLRGAHRALPAERDQQARLFRDGEELRSAGDRGRRRSDCRGRGAVRRCWEWRSSNRSQFFVELLSRTARAATAAPREGAITLARPSPDFEQIMWDV